LSKVKVRNFPWKEFVDKAAGPEEPIPVYNFPKRKLYENPHRPYGPKK
jgi:hypothetical protein